VLTRRRVLIGGVAAVAAGSGVAGLAGWGATVPAPGARVLSAVELAVVGGIAEVMFPGAPFPVDGIEAGVPEEVDRILADVLQPVHAAGFRAFVQSLEWGTLASRGKRFSVLSREERADVLERWLSPDIFARRVAADALRIILGMAYFAHPAVLAHMGWRAECGNGAS
jgi:hypothetical protein